MQKHCQIYSCIAYVYQARGRARQWVAENWFSWISQNVTVGMAIKKDQKSEKNQHIAIKFLLCLRQPAQHIRSVYVHVMQQYDQYSSVRERHFNKRELIVAVTARGISNHSQIHINRAFNFFLLLSLSFASLWTITKVLLKKIQNTKRIRTHGNTIHSEQSLIPSPCAECSFFPFGPLSLDIPFTSLISNVMNPI